MLLQYGFYLYDGAMMRIMIGNDVARIGEKICDEPIVPDVETDNQSSLGFANLFRIFREGLV